MGWAYQNLGDFDHALANFQEAERLAKEIGMTSYRVLWLQDAGLAEYKLGNLEEARKYDEEALQSALTLPAANEIDQIVNIETNLALLLYEQGQYDAAKSHSDAAVLAARNSKDDNVVAYADVRSRAARRPAGPGRAEAERKLCLHGPAIGHRPRDLERKSKTRWRTCIPARHQPQQAELWYRRSIQTFEDEALLRPG